MSGNVVYLPVDRAFFSTKSMICVSVSSKWGSMLSISGGVANELG
jgi:hypothetical protein